MQPYDRAGLEPCLDEVLSDPIVIALMTKDSVSRHEVLSLVTATRARLQSNGSSDVVAWRCNVGERTYDRHVATFRNRTGNAERCCA